MANEEIKGGMYLLFQSSSGKGYVGSTNDFNRRIGRHMSELRHNKHSNQHLQRSYNKDPSFEIVKGPIPNRELSFTCEQIVIDSYLPQEKLFNKSTNARYCKGEGPMSEETKKKISESTKGNQNWLGKKHTDETKAKMSAWQIGKKHSPETIEKLKECMRGKQPPQAMQEAALRANIGRPMPAHLQVKLKEISCKPVQVGETTYESLRAAAKAHGITDATAHNRINKSNKFPEWDYKT